MAKKYKIEFIELPFIKKIKQLNRLTIKGPCNKCLVGASCTESCYKKHNYESIADILTYIALFPSLVSYVSLLPISVMFPQIGKYVIVIMFLAYLITFLKFEYFIYHTQTQRDRIAFSFLVFLIIFVAMYNIIFLYPYCKIKKY